MNYTWYGNIDCLS